MSKDELMDPSDTDLDDELGSAEPQGRGARTFVAGLLIGALVGGGVALLFAPQSGSDTRRLIRRRARRLAADAQDRYDDVKSRLRQARRRRGQEDEATG